MFYKKLSSKEIKSFGLFNFLICHNKKGQFAEESKRRKKTNGVKFNKQREIYREICN